MGKVEKITVLSVLFLVAAILIAAWSQGDGLPGQEDPLIPKPPAAGEPAGSQTEVPPRALDELGTLGIDPSQDGPQEPAALAAASRGADSAAGRAERSVQNMRDWREQREAQGTAAHSRKNDNKAASAASTDAGGREHLLSSTVGARPVEAATRVVLPPGSILRTARGLADSYLPEFKFYTWKSGDTPQSVAKRYYGDEARVALLRRANEGVTKIVPGQRIYVPVFDLEASADKEKQKRSKEKVSMHCVSDGESLWTIAKKYYGKGHVWRTIFEANPDVLKREDSLAVGMMLRIP